MRAAVNNGIIVLMGTIILYSGSFWRKCMTLISYGDPNVLRFWQKHDSNN